MPIQQLTDEQQKQFNDMFSALEQHLGSDFEAHRDTFMTPPLRYFQSALFPANKDMSRATMYKRLERALDAACIVTTKSRTGKGMYMRDLFTIGDISILICSARRGGRMIGFEHVKDAVS